LVGGRNNHKSSQFELKVIEERSELLLGPRKPVEQADDWQLRVRRLRHHSWDERAEQTTSSDATSVFDFAGSNNLLELTGLRRVRRLVDEIADDLASREVHGVDI
jgi:hypothetical protein